MPNRILKESICYSEKINRLSYFEEVLFYRLMVNCDDFGRLDARPEFLRSRCFPVKPRVSKAAMETALLNLERAGLIRLYAVEDAVFLLLPGWTKHQNVKVQRPRFPAPSDGQNFGQKGGSLNPIQSESESESVSESESKSISESKEKEREREKERENSGSISEDFAVFWEAYPVKIRKDRAREAYEEMVNVPLETLLRAIAMQKLSVTWTTEGGKYIPYPANWLKNRGWEDQLPRTIPRGALGQLGEAELEAIDRVVRKKEN